MLGIKLFDLVAALILNIPKSPLHSANSTSMSQVLSRTLFLTVVAVSVFGLIRFYSSTCARATKSCKIRILAGLVDASTYNT